MAKSKQNPLIDLGNVTVSAFNAINNKNNSSKKKSAMLGVDDNLKNTPNNVVSVFVYTPQDKHKHKYFHSLSIDKQVQDFMGTAELRCPFDSDLMQYWEPIRNYCIIYGSNKGAANAKILFIGRVRGVKQEGYELVIQFQDAYWKFKQVVSQSYAKDNVLNKDGYTIMRLMLEALKFDSYTITEGAKKRLQQVGMDKDGNLTINKKKLQYMPDLLKRLKYSNPSKLLNKDTIASKVKESKQGNVKDINYTLKYEKPTPVMKKIASQGSKSGGGFSPGSNIYSTNYGSQSSSSGGSSSGIRNINTSGAPSWVCESVSNSDINKAMQQIWLYHRNKASSTTEAQNAIFNLASNSPQTYRSQASPCLSTLSNHCEAPNNAARDIKNHADWLATKAGIGSAVSTLSNAYNSARDSVIQGLTNIGQAAYTGIVNTGRAAYNLVNNAGNWLRSGINSLFGG